MVGASHFHYLVSFLWDGGKDYFGKCMQAQDLRFFLDSGAFTAWSRGAEIDLDEYCEFIRHNIEYLDVYANLDFIPGVKGRAATPAEREEAAARSWDNYLYMRDAGLSPLPVYHYGEDPKWLEKMLAYGCDYIALGGSVGISRQLRQLWFDRVFSNYLTDANGYPLVKVHGFGMTSIPHIFRYPWYSVDSTSWLQVTMNGAVYLPATGPLGEFVFDQVPDTIHVSSGVPGKDDTKRVPLITTQGDGIMELLRRWLAECGVTFEQCSEDYYYRALANIIFFKKVAELKVDRPFSNKTIVQGRFFE